MGDNLEGFVGCIVGLFILVFWSLVIWGLFELIMLIQRS